MCCFDVKCRRSVELEKKYVPDRLHKTIDQNSNPSLRSSRILDVITPSDLVTYRLSVIEVSSTGSSPSPRKYVQRSHTYHPLPATKQKNVVSRLGITKSALD